MQQAQLDIFARQQQAIESIRKAYEELQRRKMPKTNGKPHFCLKCGYPCVWLQKLRSIEYTWVCLNCHHEE